MMDLLLRVTNWSEYERALSTLKEYDEILCRTGKIKSTLLQK